MCISICNNKQLFGLKTRSRCRDSIVACPTQSYIYSYTVPKNATAALSQKQSESLHILKPVMKGVEAQKNPDIYHCIFSICDRLVVYGDSDYFLVQCDFSIAQ